MHWPRYSAGGLLKVLFGALALLCILMLTKVEAQTPPCPSLVVSAYAKPKSARKPGSAFAVFAQIRTTSATSVHNVSLRITVPFSATYPSMKRSRVRRNQAVIVAPNAYWLSFSLAPGKGRVFKLSGRVNKCNVAGPFDVDVAAYITDTGCSTTSGNPIQVCVSFMTCV